MIILVKTAFHMPSTAGAIITDILMGRRVQLMQYIDFRQYISPRREHKSIKWRLNISKSCSFQIKMFQFLY